MAISCRWERKFFQLGYRRVAGLDEVGRGALAGPIMAAGVIFTPVQLNQLKNLKGVNDSKKLSAQQRENFFPLIKKKCQAWALAKVEAKIIDRIGIEKANHLVLEKVLKKIKAEVALIDGRIKLNNKKTKLYSIVKGDQKVFSIAAASILAKVSRDQLMVKLDKQHPQYGFKRHKGYGTALHYARLAKNGFCPCHRLSFRLK